MNYGPPRGMRDFYPDDMRRLNRLFSIWREAARLHGFQEYDAPVVETEELLTRKSGEEIVRQIYNFTDKSGRALALRPEMTPSLARMIIARQNALSFPLKWFSIPQCFRYERMTKGRKREHYQWNLDIVGEESVIAEAEVLSAALYALKLAGLGPEHLKVRVGDRTLLEHLFKASGLPTEHFGAVCLALDKRGKISDEEMSDLLEKEGLPRGSVDKVFELLAVKSMDEAGTMLDDDSSLQDMLNLFALMDEYGWSDHLCFDLSVIRGLDYYTGIVFEAFDESGRFRAIFGGGRYDNLLSSLGGRRIPSVGLGFGDVVISELMDHLGLAMEDASGLDAVIGYMSAEERTMAVRGAARLRQAGKRVDLELKPLKAKKLFASASRARARFALYVGPSEREQGVLTIKNLESGQQDSVPPDKLIGFMESN